MQTTLGIIAAIISTASWAVCTLILKKLGERLDPIGMTAAKSVLSVCFLVIFMCIFGYKFYIPAEFLIPVALSGIIGITIGDSLFCLTKQVITIFNNIDIICGTGYIFRFIWFFYARRMSVCF